jgi:CxxC motif-containing protein
MEEETKVICITCPKGCALDVTKEGETILKIEQGCKRGHDYVRAEMVDPRRMVATTVQVQGGIHPLLPVYTAAAFPKGRIQDLLSELRKISLNAPVQMGDVVLANALGTGIDIVASRNVELQQG